VTVDDWDREHLRPFLRCGKSSARLFMTRNAAIASEANPVNVDEVREAEAVSLLAMGVTNLGAGQAREVASQIGEWPLALELAAMLREPVASNGPLASRHKPDSESRRDTHCRLIGSCHRSLS
jgi:hypothetical protein